MEYHNADNSYVRDSVTQDFNNMAGSVGPKVSDVRHRFQMVRPTRFQPRALPPIAVRARCVWWLDYSGNHGRAQCVSVERR